MIMTPRSEISPALQARPEVLAAALYVGDGALYAQFLRPGCGGCGSFNRALRAFT
jgi:hypothetical protein